MTILESFSSVEVTTSAESDFEITTEPDLGIATVSNSSGDVSYDVPLIADRLDIIISILIVTLSVVGMLLGSSIFSHFRK